jgi:prevent-host-death family protein
MKRSTYAVSVTEAQKQLPRLIRDAEAGRPIGISRHDETVAYIVSRARLDALVETMEILANPKARKAIEDHRAGKLKFLSLSALDRSRERRLSWRSRWSTSCAASRPSRGGAFVEP